MGNPELAERQGTIPGAINARGAVAGCFIDSENARHGFLRDAGGAFTSMEIPREGSSCVTSISDKGELTGWYGEPRTSAGHSYFEVYQAVNVHGFLRDEHGFVTSFDVPEAGTAPGQGTWPIRINERGSIAGTYKDPSGTAHAFFRDREGVFAPIDILGARETRVIGLSEDDTVMGSFTDADRLIHAFVFKPTGALKVIDLPDIGTIRLINLTRTGVVVGWYSQSGHASGFIYGRGVMTTIDAEHLKFSSSPATALSARPNPPGSESASPKPTSNAAGDIRSVDFRNFDYHSEVLQKTVHSKNGNWKDETSGDLFSVAKVLYGDLKGDGGMEAIVLVVIIPGGIANQQEGELFIFSPSTTGPRLLQTLSFADASHGDQVDWSRITDVEASKGQLEISYSEGQCHACNDWLVTSHFRWNGTQFIRVAVDRKPLSSPQTPPTISLFNPQVNGLTASFNGVMLPTFPGASIPNPAQWSFGDRSTAISWFPATHTFAHAGTYTVTVTTMDSNGLSASASVSVTVR
jgi:hypothetical protein